MAETRTLTGTVGETNKAYDTIVRMDADAPKHLSVLWLRPNDLKGAKEGDRVRLTYFSTASYGLWSVSEIVETTNG